MSRLIDADDFVKRLEEYVEKFYAGERFGNTLGVIDITILIGQQPTADAVKHGNWTEVQRYGDNVNSAICECSVCKDTVWVYLNSERKWNYCPHCGARMDGDKSE